MTETVDWMPTDEQLWAFLQEEGLALLPIFYGNSRAWACCANNAEDLAEADPEDGPRNAIVAAYLRRRVMNKNYEDAARYDDMDAAERRGDP